MRIKITKQTIKQGQAQASQNRWQAIQQAKKVKTAQVLGIKQV
jgi:hypothetical protein